MKITKNHARKVLEVVDQGLCSGLGRPEPGSMCVEAAVCFALGLPHGDDPECVSPVLRSLKIRLNDANWPNKADRAKGMRELAILQLGTKDTLDEKEFVNRLVIATVQITVADSLQLASEKQKDPAKKEKLAKASDNCRKVKTRQEAKEAALEGRAAAYAAAAAAADAAYAAAAYAAADAAADAAYAAADAAVYAAAAYAAAAAATADAAAYAAAAYAAADASLNILLKFAKLVAKILIDMKVPAVKWLDLLQ